MYDVSYSIDYKFNLLKNICIIYYIQSMVFSAKSTIKPWVNYDVFITKL